MGVGQHAYPQVGVLGLGPIIIREGVPQGGPFWGSPTRVHFAVCHGPGNRAPTGL